MKKLLTISIVAMICAVSFTACNSNKFKTTENGLQYRFETTVADGQQPVAGDVLTGELVITFENDTVFTNEGHPDRILQVFPNRFKGDLSEGLMMMHVGDKATFKVSADSMARFAQMPPQYQSGAGQYLTFTISLMDIVSEEELAQEQANFVQEMEQRKNDEAGLIAKYVADNNITAKPTADGLYIIVNKKGDGPKVAVGKTVAINYTGRLIDGTLFDTSRKADAKAANKLQEGRTYEPLTYTVGQMGLIKGWEEGVMGQPAGTDLTLIIPSELAYGARGASRDILPYSPLVFNLTIESVE